MRRLIMLTVITGIGITACSGSDERSDPPAASTTAPHGTTADLASDAPATGDGVVDDTIAPDVEGTIAPDVDEAGGAEVDEAGGPESDVDGDAAEPSDGAEAMVTAPITTVPTPVTEDDLARFVAAAESAIEETSLAGVVLEEPEIYIALAQTACARFSDGESFDQIADDMLSDLGSDGSSDDERLVGAILGAASRTICPEHADKI